MDSDEILEELHSFIMEHQVCEEENAIVPLATKEEIILTCHSCDERVVIGHTDDGI